MENQSFIRDAIAALSRQLKAGPLVAPLAAAPVRAHELPPFMIRPTAHEKVAIALHRADWL